MRTSRRLASTAAAFALSILPVLAGDAASGKPAETGKDNAVQRIEAATAKQVEILTGLLSKLPEQAQPAIEKAIAAAGSGRDKAIAAITGHGGSGDDGSEEGVSTGDIETPENSGEPELIGLERARAAVAAGFDRSAATLQGLLDEVPSQAVSRIERALGRLDGARSVALRNLDGLIAGEKPDHPAPERAGRPELPPRPDRPERPERPERPQAPDRPERPQVPDRPSQPNG